MEKQTPIQEAIEYCTKLKANSTPDAWHEGYNTAMLVALDCLQKILPKEKQFLSDAFQAGADFATEVFAQPAHTKKYQHPDHKEFISQYYPETKPKEESNDRKG